MTTTADPTGTDRRFRFDFTLSVVVALVVATPYLSHEAGAAGASVLLASSLMVRRMLPSVALAAATVGALGQLLASSIPLFGIVVVPILIYSVARWSSRTQAQAALVLGLTGALLGPARWAAAVDETASALIYFAMGVTGCAGIVLAAFLVGRRRREAYENKRARQQAELERSRLMVAEQQQRATMAAADERNRIARELHDIIAHSLSVIVVQAEGGRALAAKRPERAIEVLGTIAETSRGALEEMRRMVGLLRSGQGEAEGTNYLPTPGLDAIPDLVRKTSDTAELVVLGDRPPVSQAMALTVYRIVQESLTNVLKHAGPGAAAWVTLTYHPSSVEIEVSDDGRGAAAVDDGRGHGLRGMAERVALHGGVLSTAPRRGGGFTVRASLPLAGSPHPQPTANGMAQPRPTATAAPPPSPTVRASARPARLTSRRP